ncbi:aminotransferase [Phascolomyces articulosus]|uniref:Aminotransferase n=1 Tax=Phascolomyces articulosus TaxID=60185 RepID=A0AAD5KM54_9FUNG|nr:aminotransferase [Phascolomyces articulosus]
MARSSRPFHNIQFVDSLIVAWLKKLGVENGKGHVQQPHRLFTFLFKTSSRRHIMTSSKISSLIVEQTNPLETGRQATYTIRQVDNMNANEFVVSFPRGAYTGMRTVQKTAVVELSSHMKRLTSSLSLIKFVPENHDVEPEYVSNQLRSFRDPVKLEEKLVSLLKTGLSSFHHEDQETKIMVIVAYSHQEQRPHFAAQFLPLSSPVQHRVKVEIENKSREAPVVKDSQWVRDRAGLEKSKAHDVNEVLLTDDSGNLYEGMSSNFFAVKMDEEGKPIVMCAPLEHVLLGTVMKIVMRVCEKHRIPIEWGFPQIGDARANKWKGCFLTSTSRLLLPIEGLYFNDGSAPILFPEASEHIEFLRNQVQQEIYERACKILE